MTTEILGFIIIVGAIIVFLARKQLQKVEDDPEVLEASAGRLRYELEQSADEIIDRMAGHIDHLERLLKEADYKIELLQRRLDDVQMVNQGMNRGVSYGYEHQGHDVLESTAQEPTDFSSVLLNTMEEKGAVPVPEQERTLESEQADNESATDFSKALEAIREVSMDLENKQKSMGLTSEQMEAADLAWNEGSVQPETENKEADDAGLAIEAATDMARKLLRAGYGPEQVAQMSGLGLGAISLLMQMQKK